MRLIWPVVVMLMVSPWIMGLIGSTTALAPVPEIFISDDFESHLTTTELKNTWDISSLDGVAITTSIANSGGKSVEMFGADGPYLGTTVETWGWRAMRQGRISFSVLFPENTESGPNLPVCQGIWEVYYHLFSLSYNASGRWQLRFLNGLEIYSTPQPVIPNLWYEIDISFSNVNTRVYVNGLIIIDIDFPAAGLIQDKDIQGIIFGSYRQKTDENFKLYIDDFEVGYDPILEVTQIDNRERAKGLLDTAVNAKSSAGFLPSLFKELGAFYLGKDDMSNIRYTQALYYYSALYKDPRYMDALVDHGDNLLEGMRSPQDVPYSYYSTVIGAHNGVNMGAYIPQAALIFSDYTEYMNTLEASHWAFGWKKWRDDLPDSTEPWIGYHLWMVEHYLYFGFANKAYLDEIGMVVNLLDTYADSQGAPREFFTETSIFTAETGITVHALICLAEVLGDDTILESAIGFFDSVISHYYSNEGHVWASSEDPGWDFSSQWAWAISALYLNQITGTESYINVFREITDFLISMKHFQSSYQLGNLGIGMFMDHYLNGNTLSLQKANTIANYTYDKFVHNGRLLDSARNQEGREGELHNVTQADNLDSLTSLLLSLDSGLPMLPQSFLLKPFAIDLKATMLDVRGSHLTSYSSDGINISARFLGSDNHDLYLVLPRDYVIQSVFVNGFSTSVEKLEFVEVCGIRYLVFQDVLFSNGQATIDISTFSEKAGEQPADIITVAFILIIIASTVAMMIGKRVRSKAGEEPIQKRAIDKWMETGESRRDYKTPSSGLSIKASESQAPPWVENLPKHHFLAGDSKLEDMKPVDGKVKRKDT